MPLIIKRCKGASDVCGDIETAAEIIAGTGRDDPHRRRILHLQKP